MPMAGLVMPAVQSDFATAPVTVSATLAANEALARKRRAGIPVLPLAFGEAGLPVHPVLRAALAAEAGRGDYGPVARPGLVARSRRGLLAPPRPDH